jgi:putative endonuclease
MYFVYAIQSLSKKRIYIGHTKDFNKRLQYHNAGYVKSTSDARPWVLIALDQFETRSNARWIERELKRPSSKRKKWISQKKVGITS